MINYFKSYIFNLFLALLFFNSCNNLLPDLARDNSSDIKNAKNTLQCINPVVVYDSYGDNIPSPGETVYIKVFLKNNSNKIVHFVTGTFSTENPYVHNLLPSAPVNFWSGNGLNFIEPGQEAYGAYKDASNNSIYSMKFDLLPNTPDNTEILFNTIIKDIYNNQWTSNFKITVKKVLTDVRYNNYTVVYDNNLNGIINRGETVYLKTFLLNSGTNTTKEIKGVVSCTSPYISNITTDTVSYLTSNLSNVASSGVQVFGYFNTAPNGSIYTVKFDVSNSTPSGSEIPFRIEIKDIFNNTKIDTLKIIVQ